MCNLICQLYIFELFFFKQKTAYEMRISDWSSDVCSSDLPQGKMARMATPSSGTPPTEADFHPRRGCGAGLCRVWPSGSVAISLKVIGIASCRVRVCQYV